MRGFDQALKLNGLGDIIEAQYGKWGHFEAEDADVIIAAAGKETGSYFRPILAAQLAVTIMNESIFNLRQAPNTNTEKRPENIHCPAAWDFGWGQINFWWNVLEAWEGNTRMTGLSWLEVFGRPPFEPFGPFTGEPVTHTRACARIILSKNPSLDATGVSESVQETQVVHYTGGDPERKAHRRADWRKYGTLFRQFFEAYA